MNGHAAIDEAEAVGDGGRGAAAAARRERVAGAALPDFNLDIGAVEHAEELDVGLAREIRVRLQVRAVFVREFGRNLRERNHAVRVADGGGIVGELAVEDGDFFVEHFARRTGDGDFRAVKTHRAHRDGEELAAVLDRDLDVAAGRLDGKVRMFDELLVPQEAREDAETVAGFFGLGAVGVKDAQTKLALLRREGAPEDAVGADAEVAMADDADLLDGGRG